MFEYIKGIIDFIGEDYIVIENGGIGYKVFTSRNSILSINEDDGKKNCKIYTLLNVREDDISIYGFTSNEELKIFKLLLSVSKIGPKVGLGMLSTMSPNDIKLSITSEDVDNLSKAPGVGKKTARRIILELKDKIEYDISEDLTSVDISTHGNIDETITALMALGYTRIEINKVIGKIDMENLTTEETIKKALLELSKK
ncbi:Holliday junction branch migration protein RuvA [Clostridiisalibacter paucivorans]|uniref:Holliday junction branch migration protein RuvA n=1 Tax=Clostridiisalibacter paucivorans TaxID=408753 RepID=UPI00047DCEE5|nr:Holliday junction branch migration protein RuvA [Clostridiisalibacter paucivorans]